MSGSNSTRLRSQRWNASASLLVHVEDVVVHADDAAEEGHAAPVGGLVLEALEREDDRRDDQQRGDQARSRRSSARA